MYRSLNKLIEPTELPVPLADFKAHARIDGTADDAYAEGLIRLAAEYVEDATRRTLLHTQYEMRLDMFPPWVLQIPKPPMARVSGDIDSAVEEVVIEYITEAGAIVTVPSNSYRVDRVTTPGSLYPLFNGSWPVGFRDEEGAVRVRWWAGYGPDHTYLPKKAKHAIMMIANHFYANREATSTTAGQPLPLGVADLLAHISWGQYG